MDAWDRREDRRRPCSRGPEEGDVVGRKSPTACGYFLHGLAGDLLLTAIASPASSLADRRHLAMPPRPAALRVILGAVAPVAPRQLPSLHGHPPPRHRPT